MIDRPSARSRPPFQRSGAFGALSSGGLAQSRPLSSGGGGAPEWVPANAKIHIDLVGVRAWTEADGIVAIDTLLGADANTENGWGPTSYDAGNLTADGYVSATPEALIGSALTKVLAGATVRLTEKQTGETNDDPYFSLVMVAADGNDALEIDCVLGEFCRAVSYGGSLYSETAKFSNSGAGSINSFAVTTATGRLDIAVNGSDTVAGVVGSGDRPSGNPLVAALVQSGANKALQSITIYDPLPSTDGLSALSETGVVNTAPTSIDIAWDGVNAPGGIMRADLGTGNIAEFTVVDPEGNPVTLSLIDDDGGNFLLTNVGGHNIVSNRIYIGDQPGNHSFSLRATDPGGLYVEQTFTLTVPA